MRKQKLAMLSIGLLLVTGCSSTATTTPAKSWIDGACSKINPGVTLSVDYLGEVTTRCALNFSGNGWLLFSAAGFSVQGTAKYPTAFACKINEKPSTANCDDSGTSSAYWGYFLASGETWDYATTGAADHTSTCGTWEGWVYMENEKTESHLPKPTKFKCD